MVDIHAKTPTRRIAQARAVVNLTQEIASRFQNGDLLLAKGPVFHTAILAGIQAAKRTDSLIPLCHSLPLENCSIEISLNDQNQAVVVAEAGVFGKTGVEMEALTAASIACLTIYDMCKSLSHDIVISDIRLIRKTGGKSDFKTSEAAQPPI